MVNKEESENFINLGVILNNKEKILMIRRKNKEQGRDEAVLEWAFPGGKQRFSESRKECVEREVLDETGYQIEEVKEISSRVHPQFLVFIVYHLCRLKSAKPVAQPKEHHEIAEIKWIRKEDIRSLITSDLDKQVARQLGIE